MKNETENMMESIDVAVYITICNIQLKLESILWWAHGLVGAKIELVTWLQLGPRNSTSNSIEHKTCCSEAIFMKKKKMLN